MGRGMKLLLRLCGYRISYITVGRDMGYGETMTVVYRKKS